MRTTTWITALGLIGAASALAAPTSTSAQVYFDGPGFGVGFGAPYYGHRYYHRYYDGYYGYYPYRHWRHRHWYRY